MASSSSTATEAGACTTMTSARKRPRSLVVSVNGDVFMSLPVLRPIVTKCLLSEVATSNPAGESNNSSGVTSDEECCNSISVEECSTPKAKEFRIPELLTCPPAPRKRRITACHRLVVPSAGFFSPPDLDLFFLPSYKISRNM